MNGSIDWGATHYEIRVAGHLGQHWVTWFAGLEIILEDDGTTTLRGPVTDQAALHGLLARVRDIGVPLISINATDGPPVGVIPGALASDQHRRAVSGDR